MAELTREGLARHRADYELAKAGVDQFYDEALPAFAQQLYTTPQAIAARYSAVGKLEDPSVRAEDFAFADGIVTNLEQHRSDFQEADAIPVDWLPMTVGPWVGVVIGAGLLLVGVWALLRPAILLTLLFSVIGSFQLFTEAQLLRTIAPIVIDSSYTPNLYTYTLSFTGQQVSYAAAVSFLLGIVIVLASYVVLVIANRTGRR